MHHQKRAMQDTRIRRSWGVGSGLKMVSMRKAGREERVVIIVR